MAKKIIAVDIDDVIADSTEALRNRVNSKYGMELSRSDYLAPHSYWGYYERVWETHGLTLTLDDMEVEMEQDQSHVPLTAGAAVALTELSKHFKIIIITSRNVSWEKTTRAWLESHFADKVIDVYFAKGFGNDNLTGDKTKGQLCKELGASWLIDDNPEHCLSAVSEGAQAILFGEYGWHHEAPDHLVRCKDWPAVVDFFNDKK